MRGGSALLLGRGEAGLFDREEKMVVVVGAGGARGAVNAERKCKQRVWAFQLACGTRPQPRRKRLFCNTRVRNVPSHSRRCVSPLLSPSCRLAFVSRCDV